MKTIKKPRSIKKKLLFLIVGLVIVTVAGLILLYLHLNNEISDDDLETRDNNGNVVSEEMVEYFTGVEEYIMDYLPSELSSDYTFSNTFEQFEDTYFSYKSSDETIMSSDGKVFKKTMDQGITLTITATKGETSINFYKNIKILKLSYSEIRVIVINTIKPPQNITDGIELITNLPEYHCKIEYDKHPFDPSNSDELETSIEVNVIDGKAIVTVNSCGSVKECILKAKITINGTTFTHNFLIMTKE